MAARPNDRKVELSQVPSGSPVPEGGLLRCKRCRQFYEQGTKGECLFHPGRFEQFGRGVAPSSYSLGRGSFAWSCCAPGKSGQQVADADDEHDANTVGCRAAPTHLEDKEFTKVASMLETAATDKNKSTRPASKRRDSGSSSSSSSSDSESGQSADDDSEPSDSKKGSDDDDDDDTPFFHHVTKPTDTLSGLALRYGVSEKDIQTANRTHSREVFQFKVVLIPRTGGSKDLPPAPDTTSLDHARLARRLMKLVKGTDRLEAEFYLEQTKWDLEAARKQLEKDIEASPLQSAKGLSQLHK
jgi:LysM repeat protein